MSREEILLNKTGVYLVVLKSYFSTKVNFVIEKVIIEIIFDKLSNLEVN